MPPLIDLLRTKENRNCWRKVLGYELESESDQEDDNQEENNEEIEPSVSKPNNKPPYIDEARAQKNNLPPKNKKIENNKRVDKPSFRPNPVHNEKYSLEEENENMPKHQSRPQITSTKSKPFDIRDTPKKMSQNNSIPNHPLKESMKSSKDNSPKRTKQSYKFENERQSNNGSKVRRSQFENREPEKLSNTHVFETKNEGIELATNENSRKSMNNIHMKNGQKQQDKFATDSIDFSQSKQSK